ncbi:pentapeptide repeat-containing protein [Prochlorothrix hollandica]|uniref:Pentapeptide repeat-containing protein n=1 Tax=Prochlorothrix hollandica PCC 9006 = CALU 1027 TaxID=317619 RepID=A0A0M2PXQ5_PROHO|nr:pentapeptide repeat-containing protein [Prochlorothrix hollandica]KKI99166.1 pentapeptide repeat-containing protein [Prochlorothrix hollandica PCC 9006 = CALU 1027]
MLQSCQRLLRPLTTITSLGLVMILALGVILGGLMAHPTPALAQDYRVNYTLSDLSNQDFSGKNLEGTSLAGATLRQTNFAGANLRGTILTKADFTEANLAGADLTAAFADRISFDRANLTDAVIVGLIATGTTFTDADITGADFSFTILDRYQTYLLCQRATGFNPTTGVSTKMSLSCR